MTDPHPQPDQRLPARARTLFAIQALGGAAAAVLLALGARAVLIGIDAPAWTGTAVVALGAGAALALIVVEPRLSDHRR